MNVVDEVEIAYLTQTGSVELAEQAGEVLRDLLEYISWSFGVPVEALYNHLEQP